MIQSQLTDYIMQDRKVIYTNGPKEMCLNLLKLLRKKIFTFDRTIYTINNVRWELTYQDDLSNNMEF